MEPEPITPGSLSTIIHAVEYLRDHVIGQLDRDEHHLKDWDKGDLIQHMQQLETALDELEAHYNKARETYRDLIPFAELLRNEREGWR
jgi:ABC-type phosphate transport system auxiliary subunit